MPEARAPPPFQRRAHRILRVRELCTVGVCLGALAACAGSGADSKKPTAALSTSLGAEGDLRAIVGEWARASRAERVTMEPRLEAFKQRYPKDPLGRTADALLAWIALEQDDLRLALA